jgi:hypothetical protein
MDARREHEFERLRVPHVPPPETERQAEPERIASSLGNHVFRSVLLQREGDGIMPDGTAHPEVQSGINAARGGGSGLDGGARERLAPGLGDDLSDVRVHTDATADALARSVSARAFTTGSDVFFAAGEYRPNSSEGENLLAHELAHVVQQRGAPMSGPLVVSQPGDALEVDADRAAESARG